MPTVSPTKDNIRRAAEVLRRGGLVAFPTETVYGLGADALSEAAVERVFRVKGRPHFDPLIVHVYDVRALDGLSSRVDERALRLADTFWPGPLTIVLPKADIVPNVVSAGLATVAVRVPAHPVALALLRDAHRHIAAPSANPFGYLSPTLAEHVEQQIGKEVDLILDGGPCDVGLESTIVDLSVEAPVLLRAGAIDVGRIEALIGELSVAPVGGAPRAPGQLESHYAPRTRLVLLSSRAKLAPANERAGLLRYAEDGPAPHGFAAVEVLSRSGDLREAAASLFASLHRLDRRALDVIYAEPIPNRGLGIAISDRLRRAAARR